MRLTNPSLTPFEIEVDSDQYTLIKTSTASSGKKEGEKVETTLGYYSSLESCLRKAAKEQVLLNGEDMALEQYVDLVTEKLKGFQAISFMN